MNVPRAAQTTDSPLVFFLAKSGRICCTFSTLHSYGVESWYSCDANLEFPMVKLPARTVVSSRVHLTPDACRLKSFPQLITIVYQSLPVSVRGICCHSDGYYYHLLDRRNILSKEVIYQKRSIPKHIHSEHWTIKNIINAVL